MAIPAATLAVSGANFLGGLFGRGGGGAPSVTKQDNYQNTTLNISVGDGGYDLRRAALAAYTPAGFATPIGYAAPAAGGDFLSRYGVLILVGVGGVLLIKRLRS